MIRVSVLLLISSILFGCVHFSAQSPKGFAVYKEKQGFHAVSPDGVLFRVKQLKHKPKAQLSYWKEAVQKRMIDAGYLLVDTDSLDMGKTPGALIELAAPMGLEDHSYLIALFPTEKHIIVVEASGEVSHFKNRREEILNAIKKIKYQK